MSWEKGMLASLKLIFNIEKITANHILVPCEGF